MMNQLRARWRISTISRSSRVLSQADRRKVLAIVVLQISFGLLDLLGVGVIGVIGALAITGVQSHQPGNRVTAALKVLHLDNQPLQVQVAILGISAAVLLIGKTVFSIVFTRRTLFFLSRRGAKLSGTLISKLFSQSLLTVQSKSMNEMLYAVTGGVNIITVGVLGTTVSLVSDISLLAVLAIGLVFVDPLVALSTFIVFGAIGFSLYKLMHQKARNLGLAQAEVGIKSGEKVLEVIRSYRETVVRNRRDYYSRVIAKQRLELADITAEMSFMPNISKYIMEVTVVIGSLAISGIQFLTQDAAHAVAVLSVFLVASTRIAPAVLRLQQGAIAVKSSLGAATPTLELIESLEHISPIAESSDEVDYEHPGFNSSVEMRDVTFTYPGKTTPALSQVSLAIKPGQIVALVGPSGAGKTTIVDVILGVLPPQSGTVSISGAPSLEAIEKWSGAISYVPQDVMISNGTVRENVSMGYPENLSQDKQVWEALKIAQLADFVGGLSEKLDSHVGDRGTKISGGQRQRLGIARAMFTKPQLLVLDEATSSLDGETEANISDAIQAMRGSVTVLMIAHRLATVRHADILVYLEEGHIRAVGTFDEVRQSVPDFDRQAQLMGL